MHSKNEAPHQHLAIIKLLGWALLLAGISLLYFGVIQKDSVARAISTPINAQVCSGGNHTPILVSQSPTNGMTVTQKAVSLQLTVDWVTTATIKRGSTTLATTTGLNQSNQTLTLPLTLNEGVNNLTITLKGGCPIDTIVTSYKLTYVKNAANITPTTTFSLSPRLTGFYQPLGVRVFVEVNGTVYEAIAHSDLTWEIPEGVITPDLEEGSYAIRVFTKDSNDVIVFDQTYPNALSIDVTAPTVSLNRPLTYATRSPELSGKTNDPTATITITINDRSYTATNNRNGTWTLPKDTIEKLSNGDYVVVVHAIDTSGNKTTIQETIHINASHQIGFVLAPNTGYLRIGETNIASRYLYAAFIMASALCISILTALVRRSKQKSSTASR